MKREILANGSRVPGFWLSAALLFCCALMLAAGCSAPVQEGAKTNDTVRVRYTASFQDGPLFDTNVNSSPLEFTVGSGQVISGFDEAVIGMNPGMTKTVTISPEKGYGIYNTSLVFRVNQAEVNEFLQEQESTGNLLGFQYPGIGSGYRWTNPDGSPGYMRFSNANDSMVTVDLNNPLAGQNMVFEITLVEIVQPGT
jgi:peptidylprolyl isomerase